MNDMKEFFLEYFKLIANTIIGLLFAFASFYLIINYYHYTEIRRTFYKGNDDTSYHELLDRLTTVKNSVYEYKYENYKGRYDKEIVDRLQGNLKNCISNIEGSAFYKLTGDRYLTIKDMYGFANDFESNIINKCIVLEFNWILDEKNQDLKEGYLTYIRPYIKDILKSTTNNTGMMKTQMLNNSSYYFNTNTASLTVWDINRSSYQILINNNTEVLDLLSVLTNYVEDGVINE